jgi:hypothetical protein
MAREFYFLHEFTKNKCQNKKLELSKVLCLLRFIEMAGVKNDMNLTPE